MFSVTGEIIKKDGFGKCSHIGYLKCTTNEIAYLLLHFTINNCLVQHESNITNVNSLFIPTVTRFRYKCLWHDALFYHLYSLLAAPHPFIAGSPLAGRHSAALSERQASAIFPLTAPHSSYLCRTGTATDDTSHTPSVGSSFDSPHIATHMPGRTAYRL